MWWGIGVLEKLAHNFRSEQMLARGDKRLSQVFRNGDMLVFDLQRRTITHFRPKGRSKTKMEQIPFPDGELSVALPKIFVEDYPGVRVDRENLALLIAGLNGMHCIKYVHIKEEGLEKYILKP